MFVCVASLSQPSSRDLLYVKCLCVLPRYLSTVVEIWIILSGMCHTEDKKRYPVVTTIYKIYVRKYFMEASPFVMNA